MHTATDVLQVEPPGGPEFRASFNENVVASKLVAPLVIIQPSQKSSSPLKTSPSHRYQTGVEVYVIAKKRVQIGPHIQ